MVLGGGSCTLCVEYHVILLDGISNLMRTTSERNCLRRESNESSSHVGGEKGNGLIWESITTFRVRYCHYYLIRHAHTPRLARGGHCFLYNGIHKATWWDDCFILLTFKTNHRYFNMEW
jgi:hypothetical protein